MLPSNRQPGPFPAQTALSFCPSIPEASHGPLIPLQPSSPGRARSPSRGGSRTSFCSRSSPLRPDPSVDLRRLELSRPIRAVRFCDYDERLSRSCHARPPFLNRPIRRTPQDCPADGRSRDRRSLLPPTSAPSHDSRKTHFPAEPRPGWISLRETKNPGGTSPARITPRLRRTLRTDVRRPPPARGRSPHRSRPHAPHRPPERRRPLSSNLHREFPPPRPTVEPSSFSPRAGSNPIPTSSMCPPW